MKWRLARCEGWYTRSAVDLLDSRTESKRGATSRCSGRSRWRCKDAGMVKKIARVVVSTMIHLVIFGLIGAILNFLLSLADEEGVVLYVLWAVVGIFCGVMSYLSGLETMTGQPLSHWTYRKDAPRTSLVVVAIKLFILVALSILYDRLGTES